MKNIKERIASTLVEPATKSRSSSTIIGVVLEANELSYKCKVKFTNDNGASETRGSVDVLSYNKSIIDWFPQVGDKVLMTSVGNDLFITGPGESGANNRSQIKLINNIFTDSFIDGIGGYIF